MILPDGDNVGIILLLVGLLIKSGFSGFHLWIPKVNEGGPSHALGAFAGVLEVFPLLLFYRYVLPNQLDPIIYQVLFSTGSTWNFFWLVSPVSFTKIRKYHWLIVPLNRLIFYGYV